MLGPDLAVPQGLCLLAGQAQGPLGGQGRATAASTPTSGPPAAAAGHPPGRLPHRLDAEGLLGATPDGAFDSFPSTAS
jgi:hypothetical protein